MVGKTTQSRHCSITMLRKHLYLIMKICNSSKRGAESKTKFFTSKKDGALLIFKKTFYFVLGYSQLTIL